MDLITVVAQAHPVSLDSGRTLHPGEIATVPDSERHQLLIETGAMSLTSSSLEEA